MKSVDNGGTSIGIKCKDGVVLAAEKIIDSKLLRENKNKKIQIVDRHIGALYSGLLADGRNLVKHARDEAHSYRNIYKKPIPIAYLVDRIGLRVQNFTCYNSVRPYGVSILFCGIDKEPFLYMIEPSGSYAAYFSTAVGKGKQSAKSELEKLDYTNMSLSDCVKHAARIIKIAHDDNKDKDYELEISWISKTITNGLFESVPESLLNDAKKFAERDDDDERNDSQDTNIPDS